MRLDQSWATKNYSRSRKMKVFYINLAQQTERRNFVEDNFNQSNELGWTLSRIDAVNKNNPAALSTIIFGDLRDSDVACFLSHLKAIRLLKNVDEDVMIVEDDVCFGPDSQRLISSVIGNTPRDDWDILFTDVCIPNIHTMIDLFQLRRNLANKVKLLNLSRIRFAGATAYIVNKERKHNILKIFENISSINIPYDLFLRKLIHGKQLTAHVIFPFLTTLSKHAEASQIQSATTMTTDALWNGFRRLTCFNQNISETEIGLSSIREDYYDDKEAEIFSKIIRGLLCKKFLHK